MRNHFHEADLNVQIEKQGFAVVPFATAQEIQGIKNFYNNLPAVDAKGTYVTMFHPSYEYRRMVDEKIKSLFEERAAGLLNNYKALFANFMVKEAGKEGDFPMHQDWTYVDESRFASYAFWIPMQDVDAENGALHVVPGSHKFGRNLRGPYIHEPFQRLSDTLKAKYAVPVMLKAGEALVWDHRLIHYSLPNRTTQSRLAFTLIMTPHDAEVIHCFGRRQSSFDEVDVFSVGPDFYLNYVISQPPLGVKLVRTAKQEHINFRIEQFEGFQN